MTTNSLLLTSERIKELGGLGVRSFQITIDGCREKHNQVKRDKDNAAFDKAVNNVLEILRTMLTAYCASIIPTKRWSRAKSCMMST